MRIFTIATITLILGSNVLLSCGKKLESNSSITGTSPLGGGTSGGGGGGSAPIVIDEGKFFLELNHPSYLSYKLHSSPTDFSKKCEVTASSTGADRFIDCYIEVEELDLMFNGLDWSLSASNTCEYVTYTPYFYLAAPSGIGPNNVFVQINAAGVVTSTTNASQDGSPVCPFDYSFFNSSAPNCCLGKYLMTTAAAGSPTTTSTRSWGGSVGNCITGAGVQDPKSSDNIPRTIYYGTNDVNGSGIQIKKSYKSIIAEEPKIISAMDVSPTTDGINDIVGTFATGSIHYFANAFTPSTGWDDPGTVPVETSPQALDNGNRAYQFTCLDSAHEELARIKIFVRKWNTKSFISEANVANYFYPRRGGTPDPGETLQPSSPLNDYFGWDDIRSSEFPKTGLPSQYQGYPYIIY